MPKLYYHPFSSYCWKVLIALYEKAIAFEPVPIDLGDAEDRAKLAHAWPMMKFPVLEDEGRALPESSIIIEYLDDHYPGEPKLLSDNPDDRLQARLLDRFFDGYVMTPMMKIVADYIRPEAERDPRGVADARGLLDKAYHWLEGELAGKSWAAGDAFTLADCSAAPSLFYADLLAPVDAFPNVAAYLGRLRARPSVARAIDEARPYRPFFPPGWPEGKD